MTPASRNQSDKTGELSLSSASDYCPPVGGAAFVLHVHFQARGLPVSTQDRRRVAGVLQPPETGRASKVLKTATLDARSRREKLFFPRRVRSLLAGAPIKNKAHFFEQNKTKHGAAARRGSHLRNNATVKLDGVPSGPGAPRSSLRCYAGESCDGRHPVPCLSVHLSVRSRARAAHLLPEANRPAPPRKLRHFPPRYGGTWGEL